MNPGELNNKIIVLSLKQADNSYSWEQSSILWGKSESQKGANIFSKVGIGTKSMVFRVRKSNLTLNNAFIWNGKFCFITDISEVDRLYCDVAVAIIEPVECIINQTKEPGRNELNRPVYEDPVLITFPGIITEKYIKNMQETPMNILETQYVLVVPKVIQLTIGDLVTVNSVEYEVKVPHTLDTYKNEYEINVRRDS